MCSPTAFVKDKEELKPVMEDLTSIVWHNGQHFVLTDITGRDLEFEGKIESMDLITHEIVLKKA